MSDINRVPAHHSTPYGRENSTSEENFDDKVLHFIEKNKPQGSLQDLMVQMRGLSPDKSISLHQLNKALLYTNSHLRSAIETKDYTHTVLDKHTTQLLGLNMLYNDMLYKNFSSSDDDTSF